MKDVTYGQFLCYERPEKAEVNRTRFTVGGDRINYPGAVATPTAEMLVAKILFNSVISTKDASFMTIDISNFYLNSPLPCQEFVKIKLSDIPKEIIVEYKLRDKVTPNGFVLRLHHGHQRHVRPTTSGVNRQRTPRKTLQQTRVPAKQTGTRTMET